MSAEGYNPMRWDCGKLGCFNLKCRPKIEVFHDIWPRSISMSDIDAIVELSGRFLMLEWKSTANDIPIGQQIMFIRITRVPDFRFTVFCVAGNAETMAVTHLKVFRAGVEGHWESANMDTLRERMGWWSRWATGETPSPLSADKWPDEQRATP
jgi:hypothetical protein